MHRPGTKPSVPNRHLRAAFASFGALVELSYVLALVPPGDGRSLRRPIEAADPRSRRRNPYRPFRSCLRLLLDQREPARRGPTSMIVGAMALLAIRRVEFNEPLVERLQELRAF